MNSHQKSLSFLYKTLSRSHGSVSRSICYNNNNTTSHAIRHNLPTNMHTLSSLRRSFSSFSHLRLEKATNDDVNLDKKAQNDEANVQIVDDPISLEFDDEEEEFPPPALKPSPTQYLFFTVNFSPTLDMKKVHEIFGKNTKLVMNLKSGLVYEKMDERGECHVVPQYILVYPFGSVTFVNVAQEDREYYITHLQQYQQYTDEQLRLRYRGNDRLVIPATDLKSLWLDSQAKNKYTWNEEFMIYEHNVVVQNDDLFASEDDPVYCRIGENDEVEVAMLDLHTVRIVSGVLAKSAALKAYEEMAEGALEEARIMNRQLKDTNRFASTKINALVDQVAASEDFRLGIDLLIKVKEIPKKAWDKHRYYQIFTVMQNEHENEERYSEVKEILSTIIESNRFQIDLWNAFKGERLEQVIIILIAMELVIHFPFNEVKDMWGDFVKDVKAKLGFGDVQGGEVVRVESA